MSSSTSRPILIIATVSILLALILALDLLPVLRGGELWNWQWRFDPAPFNRAIPLILAVGGYVVGAWILLQRKRVGPLLLWSFLGAAIIPMTVVYLRADDVLYELFARTASGLTTGPHMVAAEIDWNAGAWREWLAVMEQFHVRSGHVALSPPGAVVGYGLLNALFEILPALSDQLRGALLPYQCHNFNLLAYTSAEWASAWLGILMPLWAALTVFPLYAVSRRLVKSQARQVAMWWPLVPALVMFASSWNTLYPLLSVTAFWFLLIGLGHKHGAGWLVGAGALTGLLTFTNFSAIPLLGLFGFYTLSYYVLNERQATNSLPWTRPVIVGGWVGLGLIAPWLAYWLLSGLTPFDMLGVAMPWHLVLERPYLPWLWLHSWEWALFTGMPLVALWLWAAWRRGRSWRSVGPVLALSLLLTILVLVLSGTARGETGRVWLFFAPFVLIAAAEVDMKLKFSWLAITAGQAALLVVLAISWPVMEVLDLNPPPAPPGGLATTQPADATFGGAFRLAGWDAASAEGVITLRLDWQCVERMTTPYWFSALLVAPDGSTVSEAVIWQPLETRYPTTCWQPGEWVGDSIALPLPPDVLPGEWWISLAAFADPYRADESLPVTLPDGTQDIQIGLGPVRVSE